MATKERQESLARTFTRNGVVGASLTPVLDAEHQCGLFVTNNFHEQLVLGDSFQAFFVETLRLAESQYGASPLFGTSAWYSYLLLLQLANFRTVRAAEILFLHGRASQGYGTLRDLKDRAILLGAVGNRFTTLSATSGDDSSSEVSNDFLSATAQVKRKRKNVEAKARAKMIGSQSKLSNKVRMQLRKWEELFHFEVHGARVTSVIEDDLWIKGKELLRIVPRPNLGSSAMYMNRFCEVCWMVLRTVPMLQLENRAFGNEWANNWRILDESFCAKAVDLQRQGKQIASAIIELISTKFAFSPNRTSYSSYKPGT